MFTPGRGASQQRLCPHTPPYNYVCVLYVYRHVILRTGLKNMSNTKVSLQAPRQPRWLLTIDAPVCRHTQFMSAGAAYGAGIYLAENMQTSAGYSVQMPAWPKSMFGHNVSVMALCEVHVHTASHRQCHLTGLHNSLLTRLWVGVLLSRQVINRKKEFTHSTGGIYVVKQEPWVVTRFLMVFPQSMQPATVGSVTANTIKVPNLL